MLTRTVGERQEQRNKKCEGTKHYSENSTRRRFYWTAAPVQPHLRQAIVVPVDKTTGQAYMLWQGCVGSV